MELVVIVSEAVGRPHPGVGALRSAGFKVKVRDGGDLDDAVADGPDVLVVDISDDRSLGDVAGDIQSVAALHEVPILAVVGVRHLARIASIPSASDFVLRPVDPRELVARVRRMVRGAGRDEDDKIRVGALTIDLQGYEATLDGRPLGLTYQEFELLKFLASNPGRAFSRDQLLARVWGYDYFGGARTVDIHVRRIRAKLGQRYAALLKTIRHVGYKWALPDAPLTR